MHLVRNLQQAFTSCIGYCSSLASPASRKRPTPLHQVGPVLCDDTAQWGLQRTLNGTCARILSKALCLSVVTMTSRSPKSYVSRTLPCTREL